MSDEDKRIVLPDGSKLTPVYPQAQVTAKVMELEAGVEQLAMAVMSTVQTVQQGFSESGLLIEWLAAVVLDNDPEGEARAALTGFLEDRRDARAEAEAVEGYRVEGYPVEDAPTPPEPE